MKFDLASLIAVATQAVKTVELVRSIVQRERPEGLADFDAAVEKARGAWTEAADAAKAEEGSHGEA